MFTKITLALALILGTASGALAATKKHSVHSYERGTAASAFASTRHQNPAFDAYGAQREDAWDVLRHRNAGPSWAN